MRDLKQIIPIKETSTPLPKHIHRDTEQTHRDLHARDDHEGLLHARVHEPVVGEVREDEGEEVLEDEEAGEGFDGDLACEYLEGVSGVG